MNVHMLGLALVALSPPVPLTTAEPATDPLLTCCTLDGFCQELTELECETVSVVSLTSDIEPPFSLKPSAAFQIDGDAAFAVLANPYSFEARVQSCDERFLRSQDQGYAFNCLLDLDGELLPVMWPDFDHRPET